MAWLVTAENQEILTPADSLKPEDLIAVHAGELIPVEGKVVDGQALVNSLYYTGQPLIEQAEAGFTVHEGLSVLSGTLKIRVEKTAQAWNESEPAITSFTLSDRVARYQQKIAPIAITAATAGFILRGSILHALSILLVLSPSAAGAALSTGMKSYIALLNKKGIFLKNPALLEKIKDIKYIVFDKTGTLTYGKMKIIGIKSYNEAYTERELLEISSACEINSYHPISATIRDKAGTFDTGKLESTVYLPSMGIIAKYGGSEVFIGNMRLMQQKQVDVSDGIFEYADCEKKLLTPVLIAIDGKLAGMFILEDIARKDSQVLINRLRSKGYRNIVLISGDSCDKACIWQLH